MINVITQKIDKAIETLGYKLPHGFSLEEPPKADMGDYATNVALLLAKEIGENPRAVAEKIALALRNDSDVQEVEIAGPGFINITLKKNLYLAELQEILTKKEAYGRNEIGKGQKVNVEYVSANPTGPLHVGNARSGPIGEALANVFEFCGYEVIREFLVNDRGTQIVRFGKSLFHWYEIKSNPEAEFPEGGYPAPYIKEVSEDIQQKNLGKIQSILDREELINFFAQEGLAQMVEKIKQDLALVQIDFDVWSYESQIVEGGKPKQIVDKLERGGNTIQKDGAIWFKNPDDPDLADTESVLIKSDKEKSLTYFATDIAYHVDKSDRGAAKMVDVWGSNHAGHIPRMKAAMRALGYQNDALEIIVYQYVRLKRSGQAVSMGKRLGNFVTLRQVIESGVHPDAFKYFILNQNANTPIDFDIDLAADTSEKNPVFYIKYAHARIESILKKAEESGVDIKSEPNLDLLTDKKEVALYKELVKFPELVLELNKNFQIQSLPRFAYKIAGLFHDFYGSCKVISDDGELTSARLSLILATKYILKNALAILGIEAPRKM